MKSSLQIACVLFLTFLSLPCRSFTPNHQEACCLDILSNNSNSELKCESLKLTIETCKSVVENFKNAAQLHAKHSSSDQSHSNGKNLQLEPTPQNTSSRQSKNLWAHDDQIKLILFALILFGLAFYLFAQRWTSITRIIKVSLWAVLVFLNTIMLLGLTSFFLAKLFCMFGNLCTTSFILLWYLIPTGIAGLFIGYKYIRVSVRNGVDTLARNFFLTISLVCILILINFFKLGIP